MIKPKRLRPGDTVGLLAPASPPAQLSSIDGCVRAVQRLGFVPKLARNIRERRGFLAGTDEQRAADLMELFADEEVRAILCVRGGYGCSRIAPLLDYSFIRKNPKVFAGYSDITTLLCAFREHADLLSFHGPMLAADFAVPRISKFSLQSFLKAVTESRPAGSILNGFTGRSPKILRKGTAKGPLVGGNLSILTAAVGTPYEPMLKRAILFLEEVREAPYRVDRMLTQLLSSGRLNHISGVAIGINTQCVDPRARPGEYRQSVENVFAERLGPLGVPIVYGLPFGHFRHQATLPVGVKATLDAVKGDLIITEAAVT